MSRSPLDYLRHIRDEARYLQEETHCLSRDVFMRNATVKRAFVRSIEIIGEATKRVPEDFRRRYPQIEWRAGENSREVAGMVEDAEHFNGRFGWAVENRER